MDLAPNKDDLDVFINFGSERNGVECGSNNSVGCGVEDTLQRRWKHRDTVEKIPRSFGARNQTY